MAEAAEAPKKKGLPTIAWIGIGCGVLVIVAAMVILAGGMFVAKKVKDVAEEFGDNPGLAAARTVVRFDPDLEEVGVDEEKGTMTIRNTKTGEEITVNFDDIKNGRLSWKTGDQEVTIDATGGEEGTVVDVKGDQQSWKLTTGAGALTNVPDWVPVYPGTEPEGGHSMTREHGVSGAFQLRTEDSVASVIDYFKSRLEKGGFAVSVNTFSAGDGKDGGMVNGSDQESQRGVTVMVGSEEGTTTITVTFNEGE